MSAQLENKSLQPNLQLRPMQMHDLDNIMQIEPTIYSHPWTRGNFSDSLQNGYSGWILEDKSLEQDAEMIGYSLLMMIMDEAHLLNLSIEKISKNKGLADFY